VVNRDDFSVDSNHLLALDCHCRIGAINFGCSAGTPARGTAADRSVTSTRAWSSALLLWSCRESNQFRGAGLFPEPAL